MEKRLKRILSKADPSPEEQALVPAICASFTSNLQRKSQFDDVFESADALESFVLSHSDLAPHLDFLLRAQAKKDIFVANPLLDFIFTAIFMAELVFVGCIFGLDRAVVFVEGTPAVPALVAWVLLLAFVALVVAATRRLSVVTGMAIKSAVVQLNLVETAPLSGPKQILKWQDQSWQLVVHVSMSLYEWYLLSGSQKSLMEDPGSAFDGCHTYTPPDELRVFYMLQLAIWVYTCLLHRFVMERIKDYFMMYLHHLLTIMLVAGSYHLNFMRIGLLVLLVHDVSDIFVDVLKLTNYMKLENMKGFFLSELAFVLNLVMWLYWRLYYFPKYVVHCAVVMGPTRCSIQFDDPSHNPTTLEVIENQVRAFFFYDSKFPAGAQLCVLLCTLQVLHVMWTKLFLNIAYRILTESAAEASRKEYEGDSDDDEDVRKKDD